MWTRSYTKHSQSFEWKINVNPGSVGLPAYEDDLPFPHVVENGSPHARYYIISKEKQSWQVEHISLQYDFQTASEVAKKNNRLDWFGWLQTGRTK